MTTLAAPRTLADLLPAVRWRTLALVVGFAGLTAAAAQITIKLSWTPVPITGQTLVVLLAGTALGWQAGAMSMGLYWVAGWFVPFAWYGDGAHGWEVGTGATMGYLVGFIVAAGVVGWLAERKQDRHFVTSLEAMLLGTAIIYVLGAGWLAIDLDIPLANGDPNALALGVTPFLIGDAIKALIAGGLTPIAWRFANAQRDLDRQS